MNNAYSLRFNSIFLVDYAFETWFESLILVFGLWKGVIPKKKEDLKLSFNKANVTNTIFLVDYRNEKRGKWWWRLDFTHW